MSPDHSEQVIQHLAQYITDHKKDYIERVLANRTRHVAVVLEDIYQSQNASAVVRTCECMGLQDIHIVENNSKYEVNTRVLKGADKWIDFERYRTKNTNNTEACFSRLRSQGYMILVADPDADGMSIHDFDPTGQKFAIAFGNELHGTSAYAVANADQKVRIPMFGFTESLNLSVSVAVCLNSVITRLRASECAIGLSDEEKHLIRLKWYRKVVRKSDVIEREFLRTIA